MKNNNEEKILETTFELFLERGTSNVSIHEIRNNSNLSIGTFYHYFKNKEDLIIKVMKKYVFEPAQKKLIKIEQFQGSTENKLRYLLTLLLRLDITNKDEMGNKDYLLNHYKYKNLNILILETSKKYKIINKMDYHFQKNITILLEKIVSEGIINGELENTNPKKAADLIYTVYTSACYKIIKYPELYLEKNLEEDFNYSWELIRKRLLIVNNNNSTYACITNTKK